MGKLIPEDQAVVEASTMLAEYAEAHDIGHVPRITRRAGKSVCSNVEQQWRSVRLDGHYAGKDLAEWMDEHGWVFHPDKGPSGAWTYMGDRRCLAMLATPPGALYEVGVLLQASWDMGRNGDPAPSAMTCEDERVRLWGEPMVEAPAPTHDGPVQSADELFGEDQS